MSETESVPAAEPMPESEFYDFLNGVGNHEAKLLVTTLLFQYTNRWFSRSDLYAELIDRQQPVVGWAMGDSLPISYCRESLEPIGAVAKGRVSNSRGQSVTAFRAIPEKTQTALALSGALLEWSLDYPDHSLQQLLGKTQSNGSLRSPQVRHAMYLDIATSPDVVSLVSLTDSLGLREDNGKEQRILQTQIEQMKALGIINFRTRLKDYDPTLEICGERQRPERLDTQRVKRALNRTLESFELHQRMPRSKLLELVLTTDPGIEVEAAKIAISGMAYTKRRIKVVENADAAEAKSSELTITPSYQAPVASLVEVLANVTSGYDSAGSRKTAIQILNNPSAVSALMAKARQASSQASRVEDLPLELYSIAERLGGVTVETAQSEIQETHGRVVSATRLRSVFAEMAENGLIELAHEKTQVGTQRRQNVYRARGINSDNQ